MTDWIYDPSRWPFVTGALPGTGGRIREQLDDFLVDEIRDEPPTGEGDHVWLRIEKADWTTQKVVAHYREALGLDGDAIGHAGLKDRRATTTQWISLPAGVEARLADVPPMPGVRVLEQRRHPTKIQEGELRGNRFRIRVRGAEGQAAAAEATLRALAVTGVPNYYGPQRFGAMGDNAQRGLAVLRSGHKPRGWLDKLKAQAVQSWVFNDWVAARLAGGTFATVLHGDIAVKHETGGKFLVGEPEVEAPRAASFAISATGPMLGRKYHEAQFEARAIEDAVLEGLDLTRDLFRPLPGARRPIRMPLEEWTIEADADGYWVGFFLPSGGYATAVLREIMKVEPEAATEA